MAGFDAYAGNDVTRILNAIRHGEAPYGGVETPFGGAFGVLLLCRGRSLLFTEPASLPLRSLPA